VDVAYAAPKKKGLTIAKSCKRWIQYSNSFAGRKDGTIGEVIRGIAGSKVKLGVIAWRNDERYSRQPGYSLEDIEAACAQLQPAILQTGFRKN